MVDLAALSIALG